MKKMTKGAIVTGLGVALLLGGGGTLATWNATDDVKAGTIKTGSLNVEAPQGKWTLAGTNTPVDITTYKVVPGDQLTYTQNIKVTLEGGNLEAELSLIGAPTYTGITSREGIFSTPTLKNKDGNNVLASGGVLKSTVLKGTETLTASSTFTFDENATGNMNASIDLKDVKYQLTQKVA